MRVSACTPMVIVTLRASTCGCAAVARTGRISSHNGGSPVFSPPSGIERHILIHCSRALRSIVGSLRRRACSAVIWLLTIGSSTGLISLPRLTLTPAMLVPASLKSSRPARLGSIRHADVSCGRRHHHVAAKIGALVERLDGEILDLLADCIAAQQVADRAADAAHGLARGVADLAGDTHAAVERCCDRHRVRLSGGDHRPARDSEPDLGLTEQLRDRVVILAREIARRRCVERIADGGQRNGDRRDDLGGARHGLQGFRGL